MIDLYFIENNVSKYHFNNYVKLGKNSHLLRTYGKFSTVK